MEALAIIGAASSIVSSIDVATRCIKSLRALKQRWNDPDLTISLLIGHVTTLKAALGQISSWIPMASNTSPQDHQLVADLEQSLDSCVILITFINDHISSLVTDQNSGLLFRSKIRAVLQDRRMQDCVGHLNNQTAALNLLLTALTWYKLFFPCSNSRLTCCSQSLSFRPEPHSIRSE